MNRFYYLLFYRSFTIYHDATLEVKVENPWEILFFPLENDVLSQGAQNFSESVSSSGFCCKVY